RMYWRSCSAFRYVITPVNSASSTARAKRRTTSAAPSCPARREDVANHPSSLRNVVDPLSPALGVPFRLRSSGRPATCPGYAKNSRRDNFLSVQRLRRENTFSTEERASSELQGSSPINS